MHRKSFRVLAAIVLAAAAIVGPAGSVGAWSSTATSGTWSDCNYDPKFRALGPNQIGTVRIAEWLTGGFDGTFNGTELDLVFPNNTALFGGSGVFTGTVAGHSGSAPYRYWGYVGLDGVGHARWVVSRGSGGLARIGGQGTFSGTSDGTVVCPDANFAGAYSGTYTGHVHFGS
jgi:hypothetical protein